MLLSGYSGAVDRAWWVIESVSLFVRQGVLGSLRRGDLPPDMPMADDQRLGFRYVT